MRVLRILSGQAFGDGEPGLVSGQGFRAFAKGDEHIADPFTAIENTVLALGIGQFLLGQFGVEIDRLLQVIQRLRQVVESRVGLTLRHQEAGLIVKAQRLRPAERFEHGQAVEQAMTAVQPLHQAKD